MKEHPILFSAPMVRAILDGRKTQTRRTCKPQPYRQYGRLWMNDGHDDGAGGIAVDNAQGAGEMCPYGQPGNRLWVRETWRTHEREIDMVDGILYRADDTFRSIDATPEAAARWVELNDNGRRASRWQPSIHMPRWVSRIALEVTTVRVERLQEISDADALAEGVTECPGGGYGVEYPFNDCHTPALAYAELWDAVNHHVRWAANPFVWVVEFKLVTA